MFVFVTTNAKGMPNQLLILYCTFNMLNISCFLVLQQGYFLLLHWLTVENSLVLQQHDICKGYTHYHTIYDQGLPPSQ